jgi:carboxypeptidase C (cathepsin A)
MRYNKGPMDFSGNLLPLYDTLLRKYRMLIYSGDTDACVPTWGTVDWIDSLNLPVKKEWRQWTAPLTSSPDAKRQRAGYVKDYAVNNFTFATVQGAGHMVPTYKPNFALQMLSRWLEGKPLDS